MIRNLDEIYDVLAATMPHRTWWDTENPWEIMIGAILVQNTNWKNVDYSLTNLKEATDFDPDAILALSDEALQELIRPSGFFKNKSKALKSLFTWTKAYDQDIEAISQIEQTTLRKELLRVRGIGEETADVLMVYVFNKSCFIADRYAQRIFQRLGLQEEKLTYSKLQDMVWLPEDFTVMKAQNFHGWLIDYGKDHLKNDETWAAGVLSQVQLKMDDEPSVV